MMKLSFCQFSWEYYKKFTSNQTDQLIESFELCSNKLNDEVVHFNPEVFVKFYFEHVPKRNHGKLADKAAKM